MKFLFVSYEALITDIAWQVVKEGHAAKLWVQDPELQEIGRGRVEICEPAGADAG